MARIEPLSPDAVDSSLASVIAQAQQRLPQFLNQVLTLAHHPQIGRDLVTLYLGFQTNGTVDRRLIELAILTVSHLNRCAYCVSHHAPMGLAAGLSDAALVELERGPAPDSPNFTATERLVVDYARQMTLDARRVPDAMFGQLRAVFPDAQLVELTVRIGLANFFNRLNDALRIDLEPGVEQLP